MGQYIYKKINITTSESRYFFLNSSDTNKPETKKKQFLCLAFMTHKHTTQMRAKESTN